MRRKYEGRGLAHGRGKLQRPDGAPRLFAEQDGLEPLDATRVERSAALLAQERDRLLDADEVDPHPEAAGRGVSEEVQGSTRQSRARSYERDEAEQPVAKEEPHRKGIGCAPRRVEGRVA
jgi:hypothetical protein